MIEDPRWNPTGTAPHDGTAIIGRYDAEIKIRWECERTCMLGGSGGSCGEGWVDVYNGLPVDPPLEWRPMDLKDRILEYVTEHAPVKMTALIPAVVQSGPDADIVTEIVEQLIKSGDLIEVTYVTPKADYREKSLLFPRGSEIIVCRSSPMVAEWMFNEMKAKVQDLERYKLSWDKELKDARDAAARFSKELKSKR